MLPSVFWTVRDGLGQIADEIILQERFVDQGRSPLFFKQLIMSVPETFSLISPVFIVYGSSGGFFKFYIQFTSNSQLFITFSLVFL